MQDLVDRRVGDAEDCELIGNLATETAKRETFRRIAKDLKQLGAISAPRSPAAKIASGLRLHMTIVMQWIEDNTFRRPAAFKLFAG